MTLENGVYYKSIRLKVGGGTGTAGGKAGYMYKIHEHTNSSGSTWNSTAATVWASSLDSQPLARSSRLLLTHLTDVQNSGIRYAQRSRKTLLEWGGLPHLARNGKAEIRLAVTSAKAYKVYALSLGGRRVAEVPSRAENGRLAFTAAVDAQPESATLLYEIVKE